MLILIYFLGILFIRRVQPIIIIGRLIIIVILYSYILYCVIGGYWFGYVLILVILRGVLVLFTYMVRLIPNERFENYNLIYVFLFLLTLIVLGTWYFKFNIDYTRLYLWESYFGIFNLFIVRFLLRIILIVVWLRYMGYGAVRILLCAWLKD